MDCLMTGSVRCCSHNLRRWESDGISFLSSNVLFGKSLTGTTSLAFIRCSSINDMERYISRSYPKHQLYWRKGQASRMLVSSINLDADTSLEGNQMSSEGDPTLDETSEDPSSKLLGPDELKSLLMDSERTRLVKKLSEANQHNRYLKRQLQNKDVDMVNLKSDLAMLELELQALIGLAEEVANFGVVPGTRKINGKYIQSHLVSRLEAANEKLKQHIKGVDLIKFQEITLYWIGMAELFHALPCTCMFFGDSHRFISHPVLYPMYSHSVQVMGSFDGWSEGEDMSPEYDGSFPRFSTTLKLRTGRYEIKFLVDGEWHLSPELPTVGVGLMENNLLIV